MRSRRFTPSVDGCMALEPRLLLADPAAFIGFDSGSPDQGDPTGHTWWNAVGGNTEIAIFASYDVSTVVVTVHNIIQGPAYFNTSQSWFPRGEGAYEFPIYGLAWDYHIPFYWDETTGDRNVDVLVNYANGETPDFDTFAVHVEAPSIANFEITSGIQRFGLWTEIGDHVVPYGSDASEFKGIGFGFSSTDWEDMRYSYDATNSTRVGGRFGFVQLARGDGRVEYSNGAVWSSTTRDPQTGEPRDVLDVASGQPSIFYFDYLQQVNSGPDRVPPPNITIRDSPGILALTVDGPYPHVISFDLTVTTYAVWLPHQGIPIVVGVGGWDQTGLARNNRVVDDPSWENSYGVTAEGLWDTSGSSYNPPTYTATGFTALLPEWQDNVPNTLLKLYWPGGGSPGPGLDTGANAVVDDADRSGVAPVPVADDSTSHGFIDDAIASYVNPFVARRRRVDGGPLHAVHRGA